MMLVYHGGKCCGIKTVHSLGYDPEKLIGPEEVAIKDTLDANGYEVASNISFWHGKAPEESGTDRLKRFIKFVEKYRPRNILEVVIADYLAYSTCCQLRWTPVLVELGFKLVNQHKNSNSGNTCYVYHLNVGE